MATAASPSSVSPTASTRASTTPGDSVDPASNLVVLRGSITAAPEVRELGGSQAWQFDVATVVAAPAGRAHRASVPVNWVDPPAADASALRAGLDVVVIGTVRRRFFRAGGITQSRTEVVPDRVVPARRRATVRSALAAAATRLSPGGG